MDSPDIIWNGVVNFFQQRIQSFPWHKVLLFFLATSCLTGMASEKMFVHASQALIKEAPKMNSATVLTLKRGDSVSIMEKNTLWYQVQMGGKKGWVSRFFLSQHPPIGAADLVKEVPSQIERSSRKRSSSYAVSASARGLMAGERGREGRELYTQDAVALEKMEKYQLAPEKIETFRSLAGFKD